MPRTERAERAQLLDDVLAETARETKGLAKPTAYRGPLTVEQARVGMVIAFVNARRLLRDAEGLLEAHSPSAAAFAILAMEEAAKIPILRAIPDCTTDEGIERRWNDYTNHTAKIAAVNAPYGDPESSVGHRMNAVGRLRAMSPHFGPLKEMALYTDAIDERDVAWHTPANFPLDTTSAVVEMARLVLGSPEFDEKEATLWLQFVVPAVDQTTGEFCSAIGRFEREAIRLHLRDVTDPEELVRMRARPF